MQKIFITIIAVFVGLASFAVDYSSHKLDNGQTVIIKEVHDNPIVIIDTWIKTGSINESDENNGVAHFLEHLFFKGTAKHPVKEFDQILESKGAVTNAATSKDFTHYYILIPSQYFELALDLHSDMLLNPMIPRKELEKERKVVIEEISKNNDKPSTTLYRNMIKGFYKIHPYKRDVIGTKEVIETISREQIFDFYNKWYTPDNMITVIIGDINTQKALDLVKKDFNKPSDTSWKKEKIEYKLDKKPNEQTETKTDLNIQNGSILIGFKGCHPMTNKDSYALDVLATILGEGKSSRLYKSLKEEKQLVHSISASHSSMRDDSVFYISASYISDDTEFLKSAIFNEIDKLSKNGVTEEELRKAKNIIERDTYYSRESISNIASEIGYTVTLTNDTAYYKNYLDNINKVTLKDVKRVLNNYLDEKYAVISIISPINKDNLKLDKKVNASAVSKPQENKVKVHINKIEADKDFNATVVSQKKDTTEYLLENGATLIITKNTANDIIAMEMSSRGGNNLEEKPGIALITSQTMLKGTQNYEKHELSQVLEENGIIMSPAAKGDSFSIAVKYTKNEKDLALELFEEVAKKASLNEDEIEKVKSDKMYSIKNIKNTPDAIAFDEFKTALWAGTPYGNTGKVLEKTIPTIQKQDIDNFYKNLFPAENVVISINGNVSDQDYINYFSRILQNSGKEKVQLSDYQSKYKPIISNKSVKIEKDSQAEWIIIGWLTDGVANQKDWATLQVIDSLLGTGMSSRLFSDLREDQGLAYQVGSSFSANVNKGAFGIYIATNPETAQVAKDGLLKSIDKLKKEFVTYKELSEAKDKLTGNFILSMETNMDKASLVNSLVVSGRDYDFAEKYPQLINEVTIQDVIKTANKYFSKPYVLTVVGPNKIQ